METQTYIEVNSLNEEDLIIKWESNDGDSIIYGIGSNLYNKQCDARVKEIILENRLD